MCKVWALVAGADPDDDDDDDHHHHHHHDQKKEDIVVVVRCLSIQPSGARCTPCVCACFFGASKSIEIG